MNLTDQQRLKETILKDYPRLGRGDSFCFECGPTLACFTACCADVTIALTPYDVLRLKNGLGISSQEFLERYTVIPFDEKSRIPVLILRLNADEKKTCPFVGPHGCGVYSCRPWACRMYPLGLASPAESEKSQEEFFFIMKEQPCAGHESPRSRTVTEWIADQGMADYNAAGELFKEISLHPRLLRGYNLDPAQMEMFYLACYNLDKFRQFIFQSSFLRRFQLAPELEAKLRTDDLELLQFGFRWLRFALFGEPTIELKQEIKAWMDRQRDQATHPENTRSKS